MIAKLLTSLFKFSLGLIFLASHVSCLHEINDGTHDKMCPMDGANLYLKCADGREQVFGIGYSDDPIYIRRNGKWVSKAVDEFCADEPMLVDFYFKKIHLQVSGQKTNGDSARYSWGSSDSNCIRIERDNRNQYVTWKIETRPLSSPKPENDNSL